MKRYIAALFMFLPACTSAPPATNAPAQAQTLFVQACTAYGTAFSAALQLRMAGKLNQTQINRITALDAQVSPICTGPMPTALNAQTQVVTDAVTALTAITQAQQTQGVK